MIENNESIQARLFTLIIQSLIIISLITFTIDMLPDLTQETASALRLIEVVTILIFTVEYLLRLYVAEKKIKFVFSFYGLVDLTAIQTFYISYPLKFMIKQGQCGLALWWADEMRTFSHGKKEQWK